LAAEAGDLALTQWPASEFKMTKPE
jgi:hypothetical protein